MFSWQIYYSPLANLQLFRVNVPRFATDLWQTHGFATARICFEFRSPHLDLASRLEFQLCPTVTYNIQLNAEYSKSEQWCAFLGEVYMLVAMKVRPPIVFSL